MSNIPDVGTLLDLFEIPDQEDYEEEAEIEGENEAKTTREGRSSEASEDGSEAVDGVEKLLSLQGRKIELIAKRDDHAKRRTLLRESVEELRTRYHRLKRQQSTLEDQTRMNSLLDKNESNFLQKSLRSLQNSLLKDTREETASGEMNEFVSDDAPSKTEPDAENFNVLPSKNWEERERYIGIFTTHIEFHDISRSTRLAPETQTLIDVVKFRVRGHSIFDIPIVISIDKTESTIQKIEISSSKECEEVNANLMRICPSYRRIFFQNYVSRKKIDLILFSLNSFSCAVYKRCCVFFKVFTELQEYLVDPNLKEIIEMNSQVDDIVLKKLKDVDSIDLMIQRKGILYIVNLLGNIKIYDCVIGECEVDYALNLWKTNNADNDETSEDQMSSAINGANSLFKSLTEIYGVMRAMQIFMKNTFNIECNISEDI